MTTEVPGSTPTPRDARTATAPDGTREPTLLDLQRLLLPDELPAIACTEAAAGYRAANTTLGLGGDWFDLIDRADSATVVAAIGDVVGHGLTQISVMGQLRAACRALALACFDPREMLRHLDRFAGDVEPARCSSAALAVLDGSGQVTVVLAGHPSPIVVRDGTAVVTEIEHGPVLGLRAGLPLPAGTVEVAVGDLLVLYTDGVLDAADAPGPDDDPAELLATFVAGIADRPCSEVVDAILDQFCRRHDDDQAVMVLRPVHHGAADLRHGPRSAPRVSFRNPTR